MIVGRENDDGSGWQGDGLVHIEHLRALGDIAGEGSQCDRGTIIVLSLRDTDEDGYTRGEGVAGGPSCDGMARGPFRPVSTTKTGPRDALQFRKGFLHENNAGRAFRGFERYEVHHGILDVRMFRRQGTGERGIVARVRHGTVGGIHQEMEIGFPFYMGELKQR